MTPVPQWLLALVRPDEVFEGWRPVFRVAVGVVAVLAVVNAAGVFAGTLGIEGSVTGTMYVDNPAHPSETIQRPLASFVRNAASGPLAAAFLVTIIEWLLVAGAVGLLVESSDYEGFDELLSIAAWGTIPAAIRYVLRPVFVTLAVGSWEYSGSIDALETATRTSVTAVGMPLFTVAVAATLLWQAAIYVFGFTKRTDASLPRIAAICTLPALLLVATFALGPTAPEPSVVGYALLFLLLGAPNVAFPYGITRLSERLDAIGSTTHWRDVEPAGWNVRLTRVTGLLFLCLAFWLLGGTLLV